jgi:hypothetical protein
MSGWPVCNSQVKWRDISNECASPSTVSWRVVDDIGRLNHKLLDFSIVARDISVIIYSSPLSVQYIAMSVAARVQIGKDWHLIKVWKLPFERGIQDVQVALEVLRMSPSLKEDC